MTVLLFLLGGVWVAFLLPPYLRKRGERRVDSISSFRRHLSTLERTTPGTSSTAPEGSPASRVGSLPPVMMRAMRSMPLGRRGARRRRRDILVILVGTSVITLVLALFLGSLAIVFHGAADVLLAAYLYLLVHLRKTEAEAAKVRYLPPVGASQESGLLLRRSASN